MSSMYAGDALRPAGLVRKSIGTTNVILFMVAVAIQWLPLSALRRQPLPSEMVGRSQQ